MIPIHLLKRKRLWIFGDSYADPNPGYKSNFETWVYMLAKRYDVTNLAVSGTGPDYSVSKLLEMISDHPRIVKDVSVIFMVSSKYRFNFKFLDHTDQVIAPYISDCYTGGRNDASMKLIERYSRFGGFVTDFMQQYVWHSSFNKTELLKTVGLLRMLTQHVEKMLVWPIFDTQDLVEVRDEDNFFYVSSELADIEGVAGNGFSNDIRPNHLRKENHDVMFKQLCDWMDHRTPIDVSRFS